MSKKKKRFLLTFAVLTVGLAALAGPMAEQGRRGYGRGDGSGLGGPGGPGAPMMRLFEQLDLSEEQQGQIRGVFEKHMQGELGQLRESQRDQRRALAQMVHDPATEESAIVDAVQSAGLEAETLALAQHRLTVELFELLDEEQRAQALELMAELPERSQRHGRRGKRRAPPSAE